MFEQLFLKVKVKFKKSIFFVISNIQIIKKFCISFFILWVEIFITNFKRYNIIIQRDLYFENKILFLGLILMRQNYLIKVLDNPNNYIFLSSMMRL